MNFYNQSNSSKIRAFLSVTSVRTQWGWKMKYKKNMTQPVVAWAELLKSYSLAGTANNSIIAKLNFNFNISLKLDLHCFCLYQHPPTTNNNPPNQASGSTHLNKNLWLSCAKLRAREIFSGFTDWLTWLWFTNLHFYMNGWWKFTYTFM